MYFWDYFGLCEVEVCFLDVYWLFDVIIIKEMFIDLVNVKKRDKRKKNR